MSTGGETTPGAIPAPRLSGLTNDELVKAYLAAERASDTNGNTDPQAILYGFIEDEPEPELDLAYKHPDTLHPSRPDLSEADQAHRRALKVEFIRRAIGYLGVSADELYREQK